MKPISIAFICLFVAVVSFSCKPKRHVQEFNLSRDQAIEIAKKSGGEIVNVIGDEGPYTNGVTHMGHLGVAGEIRSGEMGVGSSLGGHTLKYELDEEFYHMIHIFANDDGGGLLIGVKKTASTLRN